MNVIGIVAEYNPFHKGHAYHIRQSKAALGSDAPVLCVMSGDFVQRGEPAVFNKHVRAQMAVAGGADLILELPLPWCLMSAEGFARGAVELLDGLGVVTHLSFGSETGEIAPLSALAHAAMENDVIQAVREQQQNGMAYASARQKVLTDKLGEIAACLQTPNNILAVEYLKALYRINSGIKPITIPRVGAAHDGGGGELPSAMEVRNLLRQNRSIDAFVPEGTRMAALEEWKRGRGPVFSSDLETAIVSRLRFIPRSNFDYLPDATEGLGGRFYQAVRSEAGLDEILAAVKTKRYPFSRLRRMALCAALGIYKGTVTGNVPPYARVLAANARGRELLRQLDGKTRVPLLTKPAAVRELDENANRIFRLTADARDLYVLAYETREEQRSGSDWRSGPRMLG